MSGYTASSARGASSKDGADRKAEAGDRCKFSREAGPRAPPAPPLAPALPPGSLHDLPLLVLYVLSPFDLVFSRDYLYVRGPRASAALEDALGSGASAAGALGVRQAEAKRKVGEGRRLSRLQKGARQLRLQSVAPCPAHGKDQRPPAARRKRGPLSRPPFLEHVARRRPRPQDGSGRALR